MSFPAFFQEAPAIVVQDPLLKLLGPGDDGRISYVYADAVRVAGHSCPAVAGAFLMAAKGLAQLYPDALPERGAIRVELRERRDQGVAGVQAGVFSLITGADEEGGFKGMLGRFDRRGLLVFGAPIASQLRLTRIDTGAAVELDYKPGAAPIFISPRQVMAKILDGKGSEVEAEAVRELWQGRVHRILVAERDNPALVQCSYSISNYATGTTPAESKSGQAPEHA